MSPREFAAAIKRGTVAPVYLVIGDDDVGKDEVVASLTSLVEADLRGFNENNQATRYIVRVQLKLEFRDVKANKLIWENPSLEILDEYDLTTGTGALDASAFLGQNRAAADRIADTVARRTVSSILEAF